ncbi:class I SAM-dependent methyltransferase [Limnoglobus roseus]|uniref:Methyltransferase n=1 Tax=Limnoglobus roseus TaxID=2598579 RepID=A0A5C1AC87_9BACT|nr:class I SAM-dependent methyltransferase [Limnoglobus roseus]QEL16205.1 methyltransferase [Limnoglobus roseus]
MMLPRLTERPLAAPAEPVAWDETECPLCGRNDAACVQEAQDPTPTAGEGLWFAVVECRHCSLRYTNPRPDAASIGAFYPSDYKPHRRPRKIQLARATSWLGRFSGRSPERRGLLPWIGPPGRLLDFGCGGGSFLKRMADQGWQVTGLDAAVGAVQDVQESFGLKALAGTLPHDDLEPGSFDVVTMWHSLEHVHDPLAILGEAYQLLAPGGKLIVACPNIESTSFRWFGPAWFGLDLPRHLTHFTPKTLRDALESAGYAVESLRLIRQNDWLRSSAKLAVRRQSDAIWHRPLLWKPVAKLVAWLTYVWGQSDCMIAVAQRPL